MSGDKRSNYEATLIAIREAMAESDESQLFLVDRLEKEKAREEQATAERMGRLADGARDYKAERELLGQLLRVASPDLPASDHPRRALLDHALEALGNLPRVERGCVVLFESADGDPRIVRTLGGMRSREVEGSLSTGILARVWANNQEEYSFDAQKEPAYGELESVGRLALRTVICCPIPGADPAHPRGALQVENRSLRNAFSAVTREAVRLLARQLASGLDDLAFDATADDPTAPYRIHGRFHGVVGVSPALATVLRACERIVSADPLPGLLIGGETGVGKSLLVRALQSISPRADQPFVREGAASVDEAVTCGPWPPPTSTWTRPAATGYCAATSTTGSPSTTW